MIKALINRMSRQDLISTLELMETFHDVDTSAVIHLINQRLKQIDSTKVSVGDVSG